MKDLKDIISAEQYHNFTERGFFTIRRTEKLWSGNFTDQTIEQDLMRMLKTAGGLAHGGGIRQHASQMGTCYALLHPNLRCP